MICLFGFTLQENSYVATGNEPFSGNFIFYNGCSAIEEQVLGVELPIKDEKPTEGKLRGKIEQIEYNQSPVRRFPCPISEQCIYFAEEMSGVELTGHAYQIRANTTEPEIGNVILLWSRNPYGHVAVIEKITSASYNIIEKNVEGCGVVSTRSIPFGSSLIRGFVR